MNTKAGKKRKLSILIVSFILLSLVGCGKSKALSVRIIGTWKSKLDVAEIISYELSEEIGIGENIFNPDPIYSDVIITFEKDDTGKMVFDKDSFVKAVSKTIEPYSSYIVGFDTDQLVDLLVEYAAKDMDNDSWEYGFSYEVDDENNVVYLHFDNGMESELIQDDEGNLGFEQDIMGTELIFKKE